MIASPFHLRSFRAPGFFFAAAAGALAVGVSSTGFASHAAQPETTLRQPVEAVPQDGMPAVERLRAALAKVQLLSYNAVVSAPEGAPGQAGGKGLGAEVVAARADAGGWKLFCKGKFDDGSKEFEIGYDGATARSVRHKDKAVAERFVENLGELRVFFSDEQARQPVAWELLDEKPFDKVTNAKLVGRSDIQGHVCEVIVIDRAEIGDPGANPTELTEQRNASGIKVHIGVDGGLARRIERFRGPWDKPFATRTLDLQDLEVNGDAKSAAFAVETPDGYRVKPDKARTNLAVKPGKDGMLPPIAGPLGLQWPSSPDLLRVGNAAPDFLLPDPHEENKKKSLKDFEGKVLVMDFWAEWCGPCKMAMPALQRVHEKYKGKPVAIVGFSTDEDPAIAVKYKAKQKYTYGLLTEANGLLDKYKGRGIPTFYVVSPDGKIVWGAVGLAVPPGVQPSREAMVKHLEDTLSILIDDQLKKLEAAGGGKEKPEGGE